MIVIWMGMRPVMCRVPANMNVIVGISGTTNNVCRRSLPRVVRIVDRFNVQEDLRVMITLIVMPTGMIVACIVLRLLVIPQIQETVVHWVIPMMPVTVNSKHGNVLIPEYVP